MGQYSCDDRGPHGPLECDPIVASSGNAADGDWIHCNCGCSSLKATCCEAFAAFCEEAAQFGHNLKRAKVRQPTEDTP